MQERGHDLCCPRKKNDCGEEERKAHAPQMPRDACCAGDPAFEDHLQVQRLRRTPQTKRRRNSVPESRGPVEGHCLPHSSQRQHGDRYDQEQRQARPFRTALTPCLSPDGHPAGCNKVEGRIATETEALGGARLGTVGGTNRARYTASVDNGQHGEEKHGSEHAVGPLALGHGDGRGAERMPRVPAPIWRISIGVIY